MPGFKDHAVTPRAALNGTGLRDLATALAESRPVTPTHAYLGQLVQYGEHHGADARGIAIARERLTGAAQRGNRTAASLLAEIAATA
jgi:hypothetical protein